MNSTEVFLFVTLIIAAILAIILLESRRRYRQELKEVDRKNYEFVMMRPPLSYDECKEILDIVIADVIIDLNFRFEINEVKYFKDMKKEVGDATKEIFTLVGDNVIEQMKCYVTERYILQYVSRNVRSFLTNYLKEKNIE